MAKIELTHTKWRVYYDAQHGLVRVKYPLDPKFGTKVIQFGVEYKNKKPTGPRTLVHWLSEVEYIEKLHR